jgi:hypothetical protein
VGNCQRHTMLATPWPILRYIATVLHTVQLRHKGNKSKEYLEFFSTLLYNTAAAIDNLILFSFINVGCRQNMSPTLTARTIIIPFGLCTSYFVFGDVYNVVTRFSLEFHAPHSLTRIALRH